MQYLSPVLQREILPLIVSEDGLEGDENTIYRIVKTKILEYNSTTQKEMNLKMPPGIPMLDIKPTELLQK